MKTNISQFEAIASQCDRIANVLTDLKRFLGDLAEGSYVSVSMFDKRSMVHIHAPSAKDGQLRGSEWHKIVNRLSDLYGPGLITRSGTAVESKHNTPFGVQVAVSVYQNDVAKQKETTLEAVLA